LGFTRVYVSWDEINEEKLFQKINTIKYVGIKCRQNIGKTGVRIVRSG
jgi:hypothetical protein